MEEELRGQIDEIQHRIWRLESECEELQEKIRDTEDGSSGVDEAIGNWEQKLSGCRSSVRSGLERVNSNSSFREYYTSQIEALLSSEEVGEIDAVLHAIKRESQTTIENLSEELRSRRMQLADLSRHLNCLRVELSQGEF